jgi:hypothetical protein
MRTGVVMAPVLDIHLFGRATVILPVLVVSGFVNNPRRGLHPVVFTVARYVNILIPGVFNKINRTATGTVTVTVSVPLLDVAWWYPEVDRWIPGPDRSGNDRFAVNKAG